MTTLRIVIFGLFLTIFSNGNAQHSIARDWNEVLLTSIRNDLARPTVHARNLFHTSVLMYDVWAVFDDEAETYLLGKELNGFQCDFDGFTTTQLEQDAIREAMSFACYRLLSRRFRFSPEGSGAQQRFNQFMQELGYDINNTSVNYQSGDPAALGNYIAQCMISYGLQDGANESFFYNNLYYEPVNEPLVMEFSGNPDMADPNRWQPLTLDVFIDQSGNEIPFNTPDFLSPEWGNVLPFSLKEEDKVTYTRDGDAYQVYHDPGTPPLIDTMSNQASFLYKWGFALVSIWSSHLDQNDGVMWDISPGSIGNIPELPTSFDQYLDFYNLFDGGDASLGHNINPVTGMPYEEQLVPRADYARVLAEFWADGPDSETPPGHWYTILNYVSDHPLVEKKYMGKGSELSDLEWDVKSYFLMGGAMHDCAISAWGIKGYYDYPRPVSAIRYMAEKGQSSDPNLPNYHEAGMPLHPGFIELVEAGDALQGASGENIGKVKILAWKGPDFIQNPDTDQAGVGWILAENWWPYQRPSFVTPPFAGYISGHSTYSRAASEILTMLTGDPFFPGGVGEFDIEANEFLVFEEGPSTSFTLQWATYRDASDQTSLSRIWGGIHPPADDIPGRIIGEQIGLEAFELGQDYFYQDADGDGFYSFEDCDDTNANINPIATETCNNLDDDCNGDIDDGIPYFTYYRDMDGDGFGDANITELICFTEPSNGYADNADDCDDTNALINPEAAESCNSLDDDCNGDVDDNIPYFTYYRDADGDGFGDLNVTEFICATEPSVGYVTNPDDCDDTNAAINPAAPESCNDIDDDCNGDIDDNIPYFTYYRDADEDGFGDLNVTESICYAIPSQGFVANSDDCDDTNEGINPDASEVADNGIDEDCSGIDLFLESKIFPNPVSKNLTLHFDTDIPVDVLIHKSSGEEAIMKVTMLIDNSVELDLRDLAQGAYVLSIWLDDQRLYVEKFVKI